ncbi:MAG: acyl-CoA dehydratase activase-related protein [bacterium]
MYKLGIDVGSTTAKIVVFSNKGIVYSDYLRHNTEVYKAVINSLKKIKTTLGNIEVEITFTGSAGMGIAENINMPFIQEMIACKHLIKQEYSNHGEEIKTLIDIGGEDAKIIFFEGDSSEMVMNENCAGGTGAFLDQIASLLGVTPSELNNLAQIKDNVCKVAARCGVFAKTDVQNLLSKEVPITDISWASLEAVIIQVINSLAMGFTIKPKIMLIGGPFKFLPELAKILRISLKLNEDDIIIPSSPGYPAELFPAIGACIENGVVPLRTDLQKIINKLEQAQNKEIIDTDRLDPIFEPGEYEPWLAEHTKVQVKSAKLKDQAIGSPCFLGIDSGSTTTKIVLINKEKELLFHYYSKNQGSPIKAVQKGLNLLKKELSKEDVYAVIAKTAVTGYGEDLIRAILSIDLGIVETIAHYQAAKFFKPNVSFILDIGGQDMKAIYVNNEEISDVRINEACSSGCGSFIESFSNSLEISIEEFARKACTAVSPYDLGTRCTVFMNSKIKQALRQNVKIEDIAGGLAISVVKNALYKVLQLSDREELGEQIVVQGGTFKNHAIHKAFETEIKQTVTCSNIPELMGAFGAALIAQEDFQENMKTTFIGLDELETINDYQTKKINCKLCDNKCNITRYQFQNEKYFYSGNKCDKAFSNHGDPQIGEDNIFDDKYELLFNNLPKKKLGQITIGIPRILNMYENFPFWKTLFTECGINIELSPTSTLEVHEKGLGTVMADNICFPAKLAHGHIFELIESKVDRIFMPRIIYEKNEFDNAVNSFNCPIVSGYADVIQSSINPLEKYNIPIDSPILNMQDPDLMEKACWKYLQTLQIDCQRFKKAFYKARISQQEFKKQVRKRGQEIIDKAIEKRQLIIVLAGHPYHLDPLINHRLPEIISEMGAVILTEDSLPVDNTLDELMVLPQWAYPNRIYRAAQWVAEQDELVQLVEINSFGCGPDAIVMDEVKSILKTRNKNYTSIRVDEITSTGSVRLRIRSLFESLRLKKTIDKVIENRTTTPPFMLEDVDRTILAPRFDNDFYSPFLPTLFKLYGFNLELLPVSDKKSIKYGLKYCNNEICYPALVVIGDIIKALKSGKYDLDNIAVGISQTQGQCRATSYLHLIKKAMIRAGFENIPVITISGKKTTNYQPGFKIKWRKVIRIATAATIYADAIAKMYYASAPREKEPGQAKKLAESYINMAQIIVHKNNVKELFFFLRIAALDFDSIINKEKEISRVGIVGEIYVQYNNFANCQIADWLIKQGLEPNIPPLISYFMQRFVNDEFNKNNFIKKKTWKSKALKPFVKLLEIWANSYLKKANKLCSGFEFWRPFNNIRDVAKLAEKATSLSNQSGEGWLITGEILAFAEEGITKVISAQPFGCIANHITAKGIKRRIKDKDLHPEMQLLYLDFDPDSAFTKVNIHNRLNLMIH